MTQPFDSDLDGRTPLNLYKSDNIHFTSYTNQNSNEYLPTIFGCTLIEMDDSPNSKTNNGIFDYFHQSYNIHIYSASLIVNICMFYLFVNKYLYVTIRLMVAIHQITTQFERTSYSIQSHLVNSGLTEWIKAVLTVGQR